MGVDRRLTPQGLERKQQLLDHAAILFAERGYAETRIVDIVRAAGVAKGLFYWYFENKGALFEELADSIRQSLRREQAAAMDPRAPALARLRQGSEASVRFMAQRAHFFSVIDQEGPHFPEVLRRGSELHIGDSRRIIEAGQRDGSIRREDPELLAAGVVGLVGQFAHFHRTRRIDRSLPELAAFVGRMVVHAVAADDGAASAALDDQLLAPSVQAP